MNGSGHRMRARRTVGCARRSAHWPLSRVAARRWRPQPGVSRSAGVGGEVNPTCCRERRRGGGAVIPLILLRAGELRAAGQRPRCRGFRARAQGGRGGRDARRRGRSAGCWWHRRAMPAAAVGRSGRGRWWPIGTGWSWSACRGTAGRSRDVARRAVWQGGDDGVLGAAFDPGPAAAALFGAVGAGAGEVDERHRGVDSGEGACGGRRVVVGDAFVVLRAYADGGGAERPEAGVGVGQFGADGVEVEEVAVR